VARAQTLEDEKPDSLLAKWQYSSQGSLVYSHEIPRLQPSEDFLRSVIPALNQFQTISALVATLPSSTIPASLKVTRDSNLGALESIITTLGFKPICFYPSATLRQLLSQMQVVITVPGESVKTGDDVFLLFSGIMGEITLEGVPPTKLHNPGSCLEDLEISSMSRCVFGKIKKPRFEKIKLKQENEETNKNRNFMAFQTPFCGLAISRFPAIMPLLERRNFQVGENLFENATPPLFILVRGRLQVLATCTFRDTKQQNLRIFKNVPWAGIEPGQIFGLAEAAFGPQVDILGNWILSNKKIIAEKSGEILIFSDFLRFLKSQPEMDFAMVYLARSVRDLDLEISNQHLKILAAEDLTRISTAFITKLLEISSKFPSQFREFPVLKSLTSYGKILREKEKINGTLILQNVINHY